MTIISKALSLLAAILLLGGDAHAQSHQGGGGGGGTSFTAGCGLTLASGILSGTQTINPQTGTTYTVASTDSCALVTFSNAAAIAVTLPQATGAGFTAGFSFFAQNLGAAIVTITPTTSTINGAASFTLFNNQGCQITSDGANYQVSACTALDIIYPASDSTAGASMAAGYQALQHESALASTAFGNTAFGYQAMASSSLTAVATQDTVFGFKAGNAITSANANTLVGRGAGTAITSGNSNTAIGANACAAATTGNSTCTAVGSSALASETAAHGTGVGVLAGQFIAGGAENTAMGYEAMTGITGTKITGADNTCIGSTSCLLFQGAVADNTVVGFNAAPSSGFTGTNNVIIGSSAAASLVTGSSNIIIGKSIDVAASSTASVLNIGGMERADLVGGGLEWHGNAPAVATGATDCGTSPSIVGNNHTGQVTVGSSTNGGKCTLTFSNSFSFAHAPICFVADTTTIADTVKAVTTQTTLAITAGVAIAAGDVLNYVCEGYF